MLWFYLFFLVSGFCSILYELVWLRLAMAQFSVSTPFVSIVLAVFMLGLGLGSYAGGRLASSPGLAARLPALRLYALLELMIGASALLAPLMLVWGRNLLAWLAGSEPLSAAAYYALSGVWIALALAPWCAFMGATFPLAMLAIRQHAPAQSPRSFSYLYLANLSGAALGTFVPLLWIELLGFRRTLLVGLAGNLAIAMGAWILGRNVPSRHPEAGESLSSRLRRRAAGPQSLLTLAFATGLTTMGAEVVWVRLYTPYLGTVVYAFAAILGGYLLATYLGSTLYRRLKPDRVRGLWLTALGLFTLFPLFACDPHWDLSQALRLVAGVFPFSLAAGYLTPMLIDRYSAGEPAAAGRAYALNIAGCVAGPLLAGFVLLPLVGERMSLLALALPWMVLGVSWNRDPAAAGGTLRRGLCWAALPAAAALMLFSRSYEEQYQPRKVLRDHTATVVAAGETLPGKRLILNGVTTTTLTPITKFMAHLPLAFLEHEPQSALVICFGMGTTHRSMLSWGIRSTSVELTPSVPRVFSWFHADAAAVLSSPFSRIVIDDGRSYLERSRQRYDVIAVDPPPPVEAAASSLLYSKEFYASVRPRLRDGGILQQWLPNGDAAIYAAVSKALKEMFPHVRVFRSVEGWGYHFLASQAALPQRTAAELAARLPETAARDLVEWGPAATPADQFASVLRQQVPLDQLIRLSPHTPALTDDRPINEYYWLRRRGW